MYLIYCAFSWNIEEVIFHELVQGFADYWPLLDCSVMSLFWGCTMVTGCFPKRFFGVLRQRSLKPINLEILGANLYDLGPFKDQFVLFIYLFILKYIPWIFHVMCFGGLKVCAFLIVRFFHFSFVNSGIFVFNSFPQYITCEVHKPLFGNHKFLESRFPFILVHITPNSCNWQ